MDGALGVGVATLWFSGALIAAVTALFAAFRLSGAGWLAFVIPAILLALFGIGTLRRASWAISGSILLLGAQIFAVVGTILELIHGIDSTKSSELRRLGVDPTFGVVTNLVFSTIGFVLFVCAVTRSRSLKRERGD